MAQRSSARTVLLWYALLMPLCLATVGGIARHALSMTCWPYGVRYDDLSIYLYSSETTESVSPSGEPVYHVLNNAGAAHSGLHFVWLVHRSGWWAPWRVIDSGWSLYVSSKDAIVWKDGHTFQIDLNDSQREDKWRARIVSVK